MDSERWDLDFGEDLEQGSDEMETAGNNSGSGSSSSVLSAKSASLASAESAANSTKTTSDVLTASNTAKKSKLLVFELPIRTQLKLAGVESQDCIPRQKPTSRSLAGQNIGEMTKLVLDNQMYGINNQPIRRMGLVSRPSTQHNDDSFAKFSAVDSDESWCDDDGEFDS